MLGGATAKAKEGCPTPRKMTMSHELVKPVTIRRKLFESCREAVKSCCAQGTSKNQLGAA
jgi:hypothetical protein